MDDRNPVARIAARMAAKTTWKSFRTRYFLLKIDGLLLFSLLMLFPYNTI